ncbi:MAG: tetratricopeptide repeat protein [Thioalkalispiraceae bacterium]|jgi:tetratricopeptide (TPR) repeat protein
MQGQFQLFKMLAGICISLFIGMTHPVIASDNTDPELRAARTAINEMEYATAATKLVSYLNRHPEDHYALQLLAKTYFWDNQFAAASKTYDKLLAMDPNNVEYVFAKARSLIWLNDIQQAIPLLEKAWSLQNNNADILRNLILSLKRSDKPEHLQRAKELSQVAIKQFPNMHWDLIVE